MARPKSVQRRIDILEELGVFGTCSCGAPIIYFSDNGVKCRDCRKLYGVWLDKKPKPQQPPIPQNIRMINFKTNESI
jgi:hypothetical protein